MCFSIERIENDYKWPTGLLFRHGHFKTLALGPVLVPGGVNYFTLLLPNQLGISYA